MIAHVALLLAIAIVAAKAGGELATRAKQPPVLGELLAGIVLGNIPLHTLAALGTDPAIDVLAQIGALLLLFEVGLESTVNEVLEVGGAATRVAVLGTLGSFAVGFLVAGLVLPSATTTTHVFLAAAITATSVGITARVFKDLGLMRSREARTILGAAVLDDVLGLLLLGLVTSWLATGGESAHASAIAWSIGKTALFIASALFFGMRITPRIFSFGATLRASGALLTIGLAFCFFLAWCASLIGLAPIVGAFAAGLVLEDLHSAKFVARGERSLSQLVEPISTFLVPIFFVLMGVRADMHAFADLRTCLLAGALTLAAIAGKGACALGVSSGVNRAAVAFGMVPRGEVTLIFASLGVSTVVNGAPVLDSRAYSALVAVVVLTTLLAPTALKQIFTRERATSAPAART
jgi:Kef-type K+ transport system membrane component KefB